MLCFLQCPKEVKIQHLVYQSTSGDEATEASTPSDTGAAVAGALSRRRPELRGGARARSTLLAALIIIIIIILANINRSFGGFNIFKNSPNLAGASVVVEI